MNGLLIRPFCLNHLHNSGITRLSLASRRELPGPDDTDDVSLVER